MQGNLCTRVQPPNVCAWVGSLHRLRCEVVTRIARHVYLGDTTQHQQTLERNYAVLRTLLSNRRRLLPLLIAGLCVVWFACAAFPSTFPSQVFSAPLMVLSPLLSPSDGPRASPRPASRRFSQITSGTFSPCLKKPVAMGYVETPHSKNGTDVMLKIRNKMVPSAVTAMPFLETSYYKP